MEKELSLKQKRRRILAILNCPDFICDNNSLASLRAIDPEWSKIIRIEKDLPLVKKAEKTRNSISKKIKAKKVRFSIDVEEGRKIKEAFEHSLGEIKISRLRKSIEKIEDVPKYRKTECPHYDSCLDFTFKMEWPGFSCCKCKNFGTI